MFTGIVEEVGTVRSLRMGGASAVLDISAELVLDGTAVGDSILADGVCLTVTAVGSGSFTADAMPETIRRTTLADRGVGALVNLERALTLATRLGGHLVAGHVDGVGRVSRIVPEANALVVSIVAPPEVRDVSIDQGSICVDGVSLTIVEVGIEEVRVALIPHTAQVTTLGRLRVGAQVNLEADLLAKYVHAFVTRGGSRRDVTWESLGEAGFV